MLTECTINTANELPPIDNKCVTYPLKELDTLDEPISATILRDLTLVQQKVRQVLYPKKDCDNLLRNWDLWGPLLLCLTLAMTLSVMGPEDQSVSIFTGVFTLVWLGAAIVTVNAKLLGGTVSFFQTVCVIGYCLFPLVITSVLALFVPKTFVRPPLTLVSFLWSVYASIGFFSDDYIKLGKRRALALYPLCLFYIVIAWLVLIC
ncbi:Yip1 domain-containing protein [Chlamydoabsidia padenii]|nr:Yip1 domain-containing protein [Chlamydoabsidia padenii]